MKATVYTIEKRFTALLIAVLISTAVTASAKGTETKATKLNSTEAVSASANLNIAGTIRDWMENGTYWETETPSVSAAENSSAAISSELEQWMKSGSYWSQMQDETALQNLVSDLHDWMSKGNYWTDNKDSQEN